MMPHYGLCGELLTRRNHRDVVAASIYIKPAPLRRQTSASYIIGFWKCLWNCILGQAQGALCPVNGEDADSLKVECIRLYPVYSYTMQLCTRKP